MYRADSILSLCIYVVKRKSKWFILLLHLLRNSLSVSLSELNQTEMLVQWSILYTPYVVERCCTKYLIKIMYPHYKILGLGFFYSFDPKTEKNPFTANEIESQKAYGVTKLWGIFFVSYFQYHFHYLFLSQLKERREEDFLRLLTKAIYLFTAIKALLFAENSKKKFYLRFST